MGLRTLVDEKFSISGHAIYAPPIPLAMEIDVLIKLYGEIGLTRVEAAFRDMKGPLGERPIFHQLERRAETHIFICVLAYHLLVAIERMFSKSGIHTSWETVRKQLRTHQVITTKLPAKNGNILKIRKATTPEPIHSALYKVLQIPEKIIEPRRTWCQSDVADHNTQIAPTS